MRTIEEWVRIAQHAAEVGGEVLQGYFGKLDPASITEKMANDWVSEADRSAETEIIALLRSESPEADILTEETGYIQVGSEASRYCWIIDPLDGTTNFIRGFPVWAVSIGLEHLTNPNAKWGEIVAGAVNIPPFHEMFTAGRGAGAFRNGIRFKSPIRRPLSSALLATGFPFRIRHLREPYMKVFAELLGRCADIRRPGAACVDLCYVALGVFDGFWELDLQPWDIAAGKLIIEEAGGVVEGFTPTDHPMTTGDVICGGQEIVKAVKASIQTAFRDHPLPRSIDKSPTR